MRLLMALAVLIAAACAPASPLQPLPAPPVTAQPIANPSDAASCKTAGGSWRPICRMQTPACVFTYADAGKACTDSTQCQGRCYAKETTGAGSAGKPAEGQCSANSDPCGCHTLVQNGVATATLCAD